jgi:hypothetical protein
MGQIYQESGAYPPFITCLMIGKTAIESGKTADPTRIS